MVWIGVVKAAKILHRQRVKTLIFLFFLRLYKAELVDDETKASLQETLSLVC